MRQAINLSRALIEEAKIAAICKDNPDFSYQFAEEVYDSIADKRDPASWITIEELEKKLD